jgi:hypothetical protein
MPPVPGRLFLGEQIDPTTHQRNGTVVALDPASLTTHGVIVGMTGSGKTGLGIDLLEEALLADVPTLVIDPKGDLGNLLLTFPDLAPEDFAPWVEGASTEPGAAAAQASAWREGLASWGIGPERIAELRQKAAFTIFTPGSQAGVPLNLVGGLGDISGDTTDAENVADQIQATVSGLLGLVGVESDPLAGREHILLANLVATAHAGGAPLDLATLVAQVQTPPFRKLGVLEVDTFFPAADRQKLALKLNGLLASPAFAAWNQGKGIDIGAMLRLPDGRPRAAIISIAHLDDAERQFVVSLVLSKLIGWMRQQPGTAQLRALVYFDEVSGFAPPNGMPPAKQPILTLLKQARAFGVGMVLATQNPVDLDYKAISNAGTWMVGRLQTEQDKARLTDGMTSASGGDPQAISAAIAGLAKREFVLHQASSNDHPVFTTRWTMSFLRGPLTREQIKQLTTGAPAPAAGAPPAVPSAVVPPAAVAAPIAPAAAETAAPLGAPAPAAASPAGAPPAEAAPPTPPSPTAPAPAATAPTVAAPPTSTAAADTTYAATPVSAAPASAPLAADETPAPPKVADGIRALHVDPAAAWLPAIGAVVNGTRLQAAVGLTVSMHFDDAALDLVADQRWEALLVDPREPFDPAQLRLVDHDPRDFVPQPPPGARYVLPEAGLDRAPWFKTLQADVVGFLQASQRVQVLRNAKLKLVARPGETPEQFAARCDAAGDAAADAEAAKIRDAIAKKMDRVRDSMAVAQDRVDTAKESASAAKTNELVGAAGSVLSNLLGGSRSVRGMAGDVRGVASRRGQSQRASRRIEEAENRLAEKTDDLAALEADLRDTLVEIDDAWAATAAEVDTVEVGLEKTDIRIDDIFVVWLPVA